MLETPPDESAAHRRLEELRASHGLPSACTVQEVFLHHVKIGALQLRMVGLVAVTPNGATVTGASADERGFPIDRAFFELLERLSIFLARASTEPIRMRDRNGKETGVRSAAQIFPADTKPELQRVSLSNGVALHSSWSLACDAALDELIERDRVLRSFAGEYAPALLPDADPKLARALRKDYEVSAYTFGPKRKKLNRSVLGVFLFPRHASAPLVYGFGAAKDAAFALASAKRETLQRLAFLWGEQLPAAAPAPAPVPDYHQEFYLYPPHHSILRDWLAGKRRRRGLTISTFDGDRVRFADLTATNIKCNLVVAKAISAKATALRFGVYRREKFAGTPPHPIA